MNRWLKMTAREEISFFYIIIDGPGSGGRSIYQATIRTHSTMWLALQVEQGSEGTECLMQTDCKQNTIETQAFQDIRCINK